MVTLLTDFGLRDGYVGAMKGVLASLAPEARVVDISHEIAPQALRRAGIVWRQATPYYPPGSIHVAVVDPGVGSSRSVLAFSARGSIFLAPDNGMAGYALPRRAIRRVVRVMRRDLFLQPLSCTFHGRDIFAPVAAQLANGLPLDALGPAATKYRLDTLPAARRRRRGSVLEVRGEVIDFDRFGNALTNIEPRPGERLLEVELPALRLARLSRSYQSVAAGKPLAIVGSTGFLEIAVSHGNAMQELALEEGTPVSARWRGATTRRTRGRRERG